LKPEIPLIGFSGSPWTLAAYMLEGQPGKELQHAKVFMHQERALMISLLKKITETLKLYLAAQIDAGAQIIQIFDSLAGQISKQDFLAFSLPFMQEIISFIKSKYEDSIPIILFARGASHSLQAIRETGCHVISIDWMMSIQEAGEATGYSIPLQGNLDPAILLTTKEIITLHARDILQQSSPLKGFIFNLGHGVLPSTPEANVRFLIDLVHGN
jgi:uroporphyrinogen decarboxylase